MSGGGLCDRRFNEKSGKYRLGHNCGMGGEILKRGVQMSFSSHVIHFLFFIFFSPFFNKYVAAEEFITLLDATKITTAWTLSHARDHGSEQRNEIGEEERRGGDVESRRRGGGGEGGMWGRGGDRVWLHPQ